MIELNLLSDDQLFYLDNSVKHVLQEIDRLPGIVIEEAKLSLNMSSFRASHFKQFNKLTKDLELGKIDLSTYDKESHRIIGSSFEKSYKANLKRKLNDGDREYISRATQEELKHARKFGRDIKDKKLKIPRIKRVEMYSQTLNGIAWHAKIESQPDNVRIGWVLGKAEHCGDCIVLGANSPYTKYNLPTTPKAGATQCLSNCKCKLVFQKGVLSREEIDDSLEYSTRKDQGLKDILDIPDPPSGMRRPNKGESKYIDDLRHQMNYQRRLIGSDEVKGKKLANAIKKRREINEQLIDFTEERNIYEVPIFSVDDILDERHISRKSVNNLFAYSIDGKSIDMLDEKQLKKILDTFENDFFSVYSKSMLKKGIKK